MPHTTEEGKELFSPEPWSNKITEAVVIGTRYAIANKLAKDVHDNLATLMPGGDWYLEDGEIQILNKAAQLASTIRKRTTEYAAAQYAQKQISNE